MDDARTVEWSPPDPAGVPELRARLVEHLGRPMTHHQMASAIAAGQSTLRPAGSPEHAAAVLLEEEQQRLRPAELFMATAEMTQLAVTAAATLPDFHLAPEDLPAPAGLLVFAEPVASRFDATVPDLPHHIPIVAASWGQSSLCDQLPDGGVWVTFWAAPDFEFFELMAQREGNVLTAEEKRQAREMHGPLGWENESLWRYGTPRGGQADMEGTTAGWMQAVRAAWLLMAQPHVSETFEEPRPRAGRKRDARDGLSTSPVRVVRLRRATREQGAPEGEQDARAYTCRWMVSGHWRQHWYPKRGVHRPRWIAPYVKGPADAPLRTSETVHLWDR